MPALGWEEICVSRFRVSYAFVVVIRVAPLCWKAICPRSDELAR